MGVPGTCIQLDVQGEPEVEPEGRWANVSGFGFVALNQQ
jgi:hypothetical protein